MGLDDGVEPLGHRTIGGRHLSDLRLHVLLPVRMARASACLELEDSLLHGGSFLFGEPTVRLPRALFSGSPFRHGASTPYGLIKVRPWFLRGRATAERNPWAGAR